MQSAQANFLAILPNLGSVNKLQDPYELPWHDAQVFFPVCMLSHLVPVLRSFAGADVRDLQPTVTWPVVPGQKYLDPALKVFSSALAFRPINAREFPAVEAAYVTGILEQTVMQRIALASPKAVVKLEVKLPNVTVSKAASGRRWVPAGHRQQMIYAPEPFSLTVQEGVLMLRHAASLAS